MAFEKASFTERKIQTIRLNQLPKQEKGLIATAGSVNRAKKASEMSIARI